MSANLEAGIGGTGYTAPDHARRVTLDLSASAGRRISAVASARPRQPARLVFSY